MKRTLLLLSLMATAGMTAQEQVSSSVNEGKPTNSYNKWSVDLGAGMNKPVRPMKSGYSAKTLDFLNLHAGVRYMFNDKFGLQANVGYNEFKPKGSSLDFKSEMWSYGLDGVVNVGNVLDFKSWTNTFGLLAHAGVSYSTLKGKEPLKSSTDEMVTLNVGLQPQIRLGNRVSLFADASLHGNIRQDLGFEGQPKTSSTRGFNGYFMTTSVGISVYLGKQSKHADWTSASVNDNNMYANLDQRLGKIEADLVDSDQDGVADYLDREPNTAAGAMVDTKGRTLDKNGNGIPDALESALDSRYAKIGEVKSTDNGTIYNLLNNGYANVYFKFDSAKPEVYSLESINLLKTYMLENKNVKAELTGYADSVGNSAYNTKLSERRAKSVYDILVASGVDASRLSYKGAGSESANGNSETARQLVRRVTFKLN